MNYGFAIKYRPSIPGCKVTPNIVGAWDLLDFCRKAKEGGFTVEPFNLLTEALSGFIAQKSSFPGSRRSGPKDIEAYYLCSPVFGKPLECDSLKLDGGKWQDELEEHSAHGDNCYMYKSAESLESVFICYCQSSQGKSIMRRTSIKELSKMKSRAEALTKSIMEREEYELF